MKSVVREFIQTTLLAAGLFLLLQTVVQTFRVEQLSMYPTLREGQYLVVNKLAYLDLSAALAGRVSAAETGPTSLGIAGSPERGDIVVLSHPSGNGQHLIKRVIGLPGETIEIRDHHVFVDGQPLDEPYLTVTTDYRLEPQTIPAGQFFVLGDNRNNSYDSHVFGPIPRGLILGKAIPLPYVSLGPPPALPLALLRKS